MVASSVGSVVLVTFPFSDLSASKLRPALVIADSSRGDWICAQITSNAYSDQYAVEVTSTDLTNGQINRVSYVRPGKLFTANETLFLRSIATVSDRKLEAAVDAVILLLRGHI